MPRSRKTIDHQSRLRGGMAILRLFLIFALLCTLYFYAGLQWRAHMEAGWGLTAPAENAPTLAHAGVNVALEARTPAARETALARLTASEIGWVRQRLDWGRMEPEPGHYDWAESDAIIDAISAHGLDAVIVLDGSPAWARADVDHGVNDNPLAPPADPTDFARFAAAFAVRYGDRVDYYQLWDEPNIAPHWGNRHIKPVDYAQLLRAGAVAIRAADSEAIIIAAALAPTQDRGHTAMDEGYFLQRMYAAGASQYIDVVAIEPLGFGHAPGNRAQRRDVLNFQRAAWVRRIMQAAGDGDTPLWAVRYGWNRDTHSPWGAVSIENQRRYAADALALAARWPWLTGMAWVIDQPPAPPNDPEWGFALDDELQAIIGTQSQMAVPPHPAPRAFPRHFALLALATLLLFWRGWRTARLIAVLLPLATWLARYRQAPVAVHVAAWALLLIAYYLATWPPLIALCLLAGALLMVAQPQVGLWLVLGLLPFHFQHKELHLINQTIVIPPTQAALVMLLPALASRVRPRGATDKYWRDWPHSRPFFDWLALAWLVINLIAAWNVWHWPAYGRGFIDLALTPVLIYGAIRLLITDADGHKLAASALYAGGALVATVGLLAWIQGDGTVTDGVRRLVGPHFSPNHTALYLGRTLFLGIGLLLAVRATNRRVLVRPWVVIGGSLLAIIAALILTASRGAWLLGVPIGSAIFGWLTWRQRATRPADGIDKSRQAHRWRIGVGLLILAAIVLILVIPAWDRLSNGETILRRLMIWQATVELWRAFPLAGVGPGGFFWRFPAFIPLGSQLDPNLRHPHNMWLEMVSGWGALGLTWLTVTFFAVGKGARAIVRDENRDQITVWIRIGLLAGLAAGLAHGQVDAFMGLADLAGWNFAALALLVSPAQKKGG